VISKFELVENLGKSLAEEIDFLAAEIGPGGLTASPCIDCGLTATRACQTTTYSNGQKFDLKVVVASLVV
jgi:NaMN:DMB phosphoribosyltransferase